jgi:threonine dehydrogenase-like Zn-dependent dehydrogenase
VKALFFDGSLRMVQDHPVPRPGENEALIRVLMAGICGTDIEITRGYKQFKGIPGHEFVGIVEQVNGAYARLVGKRVVGEINCSCHACDYCNQGLTRHCGQRTVLGILGRDGVFAEYVTLPLENLWEVPDGAADEEMVFVEPLAAVYEIIEQVHIRPTHSVLVLGDGKLGLLAALALAGAGHNIVLAGKHAAKLAIAMQQGIKTVRADELQKKAYDIVIEATGSTGGLEAALSFVKPRGTVVLKSTTAADMTINLSAAVVDEITITGSRCGPFAPAIECLSAHRIDVRPLISAVYPFELSLKAFDEAAAEGRLKVLVDFRTNG